jgi:hypothetical protein
MDDWIGRRVIDLDFLLSAWEKNNDSNFRISRQMKHILLQSIHITFSYSTQLLTSTAFYSNHVTIDQPKPDQNVPVDLIWSPELRFSYCILWIIRISLLALGSSFYSELVGFAAWLLRMLRECFGRGICQNRFGFGVWVWFSGFLGEEVHSLFGGAEMVGDRVWDGDEDGWICHVYR